MKQDVLLRNDDALYLVKEFVEEMIETVGSDSYGCRVDEVSSEAYDGFIPYTDGGWDGVATFGFYSEPAYGTPQIAKFHDQDYDWCLSEFRAENEWEDEEVPEGNDVPLRLSDAWQDYRQEWECSDESVWFVKVRGLVYGQHHRRNETGQDEVMLCFGINTDFDYGRDHVSYAPGAGTDWVWERTIPLAEVTEEFLAECRKEILAKW